MRAPNMATITASLERSLQNCSLNHQSSSSSSSSSGSGGIDAGVGRSSTSDSPGNRLHDLANSSNNIIELNSQIPLPYHWEQCLDLKTGEIYYINWRTGMRTNEDPRTTAQFSGDFYSEDDSSYDSEGSSSESSPSTSREQYQQHQRNEKGHVLVVGGCKRCLMYFMVPKQVEDCPKCCGQLLHFDRSDNGSP